jgi:hypothetical protein
MTRGIHLKRLTDTDLHALGLAEGEDAPQAGASPEAALLTEADPVLARLVDEVLEGLQGTLCLLEDALAPGRADRET